MRVLHALLLVVAAAGVSVTPARAASAPRAPESAPPATALATGTATGARLRLVIGLRVNDARREPERRWVDGIVGLATAKGGHEVRRLPFAVVVDVPRVAATLVALRRHAAVRWVEEERAIPVRLRFAPNDPLYARQWHLAPPVAGPPSPAAVPMELAWDESRGATSAGAHVQVAVIDDGFDLAHPDLVSRFSTLRHDFAAGAPGDDDPSYGGGDTHGTATAGVIAATCDNGIGVCGICPECTIVPVRLIGGGGPADLYEIDSTVAAEAIVWAVDTAGVDVINNSWGPPDGNPLDPSAPRTLYGIPTALAEALDYAAREGRGGRGTVVTWSAGNGAEPVAYDRFASHRAVIAVGAVAASGRLAYYSDFGPPVLLVAPSSGSADEPKVTTCDLSGAAGRSTGDYREDYSGTSAAAALVAGAAALVIARYPHLTAAQVIEALARGAAPIDPEHADYDADGRSSRYGFGRLDVAGALAVAATYGDDCTVALELCGNGRDDNCDGVVDEASRCTPCVPDADVELCDGHDNDCDGEVDEDFVCEEEGRPLCAPCDMSSQCGEGAVCHAAAGFPGSFCFMPCGDDSGGACPTGTVCDGAVCQLEVGAAASGGVRDCRDALACSLPERCDGRDNDCDGTVDEVDSQGAEAQAARPVVCGSVGLCGAATAVCRDGAWRCVPHPAWEEKESSCDGQDNDCDGLTDEECPPPSHGCGNCAAGVALAPASGALSSLALLAYAMIRRRRARPCRFLVDLRTRFW